MSSTPLCWRPQTQRSQARAAGIVKRGFNRQTLKSIEHHTSELGRDPNCCDNPKGPTLTLAFRRKLATVSATGKVKTKNLQNHHGRHRRNDDDDHHQSQIPSQPPHSFRSWPASRNGSQHYTRAWIALGWGRPNLRGKSQPN